MFNSTTFLQGGTTDHGHKLHQLESTYSVFTDKPRWQEPRWCVADRQRTAGGKVLLSGSATTTVISRWCAFLPNLVGV